MRLYGSVNISLPHDDSNQLSGSVNIGVPVAYGEDIGGESILYGAISGIIIKIDIVPDEIKQVLIQSGVKFS